jgi:hypothetical protein
VITLPAMLGALMAILQSHPLCERTTIVETRGFSSDQFYFKVRAELPRDYRIQARVYSNQGHVDYAYQLFKEGAPTLRWDNKEEFLTVNTYPHHHHDNRGNSGPRRWLATHKQKSCLCCRKSKNFLPKPTDFPRPPSPVFSPNAVTLPARLSKLSRFTYLILSNGSITKQ